MAGLADWFLTTEQRGNPATSLPDWSTGNLVEPLIHGAAYFDRLATEVGELRRGDYVFFTDWRGDPDERLRDGGPTVAELFCRAAERGVVVKGLMWRSHLDKFSYSEEENQHLGDAIEAAGGEVLLDQRVRFGGSHHQKLVVLRRPGAPERDVAFAGGIDLCHSRRDDAEHRGDPQAVQMARQYGEHPPWHDVQLRIQGPVVGSLDTTFRERWTDPASLDMLSPIAWIADKLRRADLSAGELPRQPPDPPPCGPQAVQVLRTYPDAHFEYAFAPHGERSVARGYTKAVLRATTPDLSGGPIPVVQTGRTPVRQRAEGQPGPAPDRRGAAAPRRGRPVRAAPQPGRPTAGDRDLPPGCPAAGACV